MFVPVSCSLLLASVAMLGCVQVQVCMDVYSSGHNKLASEDSLPVEFDLMKPLRTTVAGGVGTETGFLEKKNVFA